MDPFVEVMSMRNALLVIGLSLLAAMPAPAKCETESTHAAAPVITPHARPVALPAFRLVGATGAATTPRSLAGKVTVLNLWATWCSACLRELPALDRLQARFAGSLRVVAVSEDRDGETVAGPFVRRLGLGHLDVAYDREAALSSALHARVLPLTVVLDRHGNEIARVAGEADWADASVVRYLQRLTLE